MFKQSLTIFLSILGLTTFVGLGVWQLQRLEWKEAIIADIEARIGDAAVSLPADPDADADRYLPVTVSGTMGGRELQVLVSSRDYGAGFRIIAPFTTTDGRQIMVDRGFVLNEDRDAARSIGAMSLEGNLHWPNERDSYTPQDDPEGNWWYARDVDKMAAALGTEPVLIIARTPTDDAILVMPVTTEAIRNDHFEYAMTWFLFAVTWVLMTGFALWRIRRRNVQTPAQE